jgi:putative spermidine/putrescine transport system permease protein
MNKSIRNIVFLLVAICITLPIAVVFVWSIANSWRFPGLLPESFGMRGVNEILNRNVIQVLLSSIGISSVVALLSTIIGTLTARAMVFYDFHLKGLVRFLIILPIMIPAVAFTFGIHVFFFCFCVSDTVLGVILIHLICGLPYSVYILSDITASAGKNLEEQAYLLGASTPRAFFNISFFALIPGFITSFCMAYIISFSQYFVTLIIGGGNVKTLSTVMVPFIQSGDRVLSASYSVVFVVSTLIVFGVIQWIGKKISLGREIELFR